MNSLEMHEIGEIIRRVRKERGLRLEDLADENISPATISNIERGVPHVNIEKTRYLLDKLDLDLDKLPSLMKSEQRELENIKFELFIIETMRDIGKVDEALKKLDEMDLEDSHPYAATYHYLKGKCYNSKNQWRKAEKSLYNAIRLANQHPRAKKSNIEAAAFNELSLCDYYQNDLNSALENTERGITSFVENGDRPHFEHLLKRNKAIYLERLGRFGEAMKVVHDSWDSIHEMEQIETKLSFYWLRAVLLRRTDMLDEAISYAKEGLEIARLNHKYDSMFDLWTVLGSIYMTKKEWHQAKSCFDMALKLKGTFSYENKLATTYTHLGILYVHQEKWNEAYSVIDHAIQISEKHNDAPRLTYALQVMGDLYRVQDDIQQAIHYYKRALELAQKHQYKTKEHQILFRLAECWEPFDEQEFHKTLRKMYKVQQELHREEGKVHEEVG